jgi:hypothetical protein
MTQKLQNHLQNGYNVNFGNYFSRGYELFKANMSGHIVFTIVFFLITGILSLIPVINLFAFLITAPIGYGIFLVNFKYITTKTQGTFGDYFKGFDYFGSIILPSLISAIIAIFIIALILGYAIIPVFLSGDKTEIANALLSKWYLFILAFVIIAYISLINAVAVFVGIFHGEGVSESLKIGFHFVNKNPILLFVFLIINSLLLAGGLFVFIIGILFTYPLYMCNTFAIFEDLLGLKETDGDKQNDTLIDSIGQDL